MRLLAPFSSIDSEISMDFIIKLNIEQDTKKLFEAIVADGEEVDRSPGLMKAVFYDMPKIMYNAYTSHQGKEVYTTRPWSSWKEKEQAFNITITKSIW